MYNAFISYSHAADGRLAPALQSALEKFAKPWYKLRHLNIFRDEASLSASPHLWSNITEALDASEYLIYMASPESASSKWVIKEISYWLEHKSLETILIVLTDGEIIWNEDQKNFSNRDDDSIPDILENKFKSEPFYIDLRLMKTEDDLSLNNPIFKKEVLKLAAHLHGKAPKDLAGKEVSAHRNMIRIRNGSIAVLAGLLIVSIFQTLKARKQTRIANENTIAARKSDSLAQEQAKIANQKTKEAIYSDSIAQVERQIALDSSAAAQEQRDKAKRQEQIAIVQKDKAEEALKEKMRADMASDAGRVNEEHANARYETLKNRWNCLKLLADQAVSYPEAMKILEGFDQRYTVNDDYFFASVDSISVEKSSVLPSSFNVKLYNWNDKVIGEIDSLSIATLKEN